MRLAIVHYTKPPVVGGVERVMGEQASALAQLGHDVVVMDRKDWRETGTPEWASSALDAVIVHNVLTMPFDLEWTRELTRMAAATPAVRWVNWVHDVAAVNPAYAHLGWIEPACRAAVVAVSQVRAREWADVAGLRVEEVTVIPNGVDAVAALGLTERVAALAEARDLWGSDLNLLQPVRLVRRKNVEQGLRLVAALRREKVRARLVVTGAPDPHQGDGQRYFVELQALAGLLRIEDDVVFAGEGGALSDADLRALYALCDGLFFPSRSEGFGLPLLEAGLHRMPVWCSDLAVHREVLGEGAEWFDAEGDVALLAERMGKWCGSDPVLRARRRTWREHSWVTLCKERLEPLLVAGIKGG
jgi:glycosyltransferase involved in cell wall biosynthesis